MVSVRYAIVLAILEHYLTAQRVHFPLYTLVIIFLLLQLERLCHINRHQVLVKIQIIILITFFKMRISQEPTF